MKTLAARRRATCRDCQRDCPVRATVAHEDPAAACPDGLWKAAGARQAAPRVRGLGDVVERLAKPIAKALRLPCLDAAGKLKPASPCARRRDRLNQLVPFTSPPRNSRA